MEKTKILYIADSFSFLSTVDNLSKKQMLSTGIKIYEK